jgi:hypothetical protein
MAGLIQGITGALLGGGDGGQKDDPRIGEIARSAADAVSGIEGVHQLQQTALSTFNSMNEQMKMTYETLASMDTQLVQNIGFTLREIADNTDPTSPDNMEDGAADKKSSKQAPAPSDVAKLPDKYGMGSLLINSTLMKMSEMIQGMITDVGNPLINQVSEMTMLLSQAVDALTSDNKETTKAISPTVAQPDDAKKEGQKKEEESGGNKGGAGGGGILSQLPSLVKDIGAFIKGIILFMMFPWALVLKAALGFSDVIDKFIEIGTTIGRNKVEFDNFAEGAVMLAYALSLFAKALIWAALIAVLIVPVIIGIVFMRLVFFKFIELGDAVGKKVNQENLLNLARASLWLSTGLIIFSAAMMLLGLISLVLLSNILGVLLITLIFFLFIIVGVLVGKNMKSFLNFALASLLLSLALLVFAIAILVMAFVGSMILNDPSILLSVVLITALFFGFIILGMFVSKFAKSSLKEFALGSLYLSVALVVFALALVVLGFVYKLLTSGELGPPGIGGIPNGVYIIIGMFLVFILVGAIASKAAGDLKKFAIGSILLSVALVVFSIALLVLAFVYDLLVNESPTVDLNGFKVPIAVLFIMGLFIAFMIIAIIAAAVMGPLAAFATASIVLGAALIVFSIALVVMMFVGGIIVNNLDKIAITFVTILAVFVAVALIGIPAAIAMVGIGLFAAASVLLVVGMLAFSLALVTMKLVAAIAPTEERRNFVIQSIKDVFGMFGIGLAIAAGKVIITGALVLVASIMLMGIFAAFALVFKNIKTISQLAEEVDINLVIGPMKLILKMMSDASKDMQGTSLETALAFAVTLNSVMGGLNSLTDIIIKLAEFDDSMIPAAQEKFQTILKDFFGVDTDGNVIFDNNGQPTLMGLMNTISQIRGITPDQANTASALVPITQSMSSIADVIIKLSGMGDIESSIGKLISISELMAQLMKFASTFKKGGVFSASTGEELDLARDVIDQHMMGLVDSIAGLGRRLGSGEGEEAAADQVMGVANAIRRNLITAINQLDTTLPLMQVFKEEFEINILEPLNELSWGARQLDKVEAGLRRVNTAMKEFTKENSGFFAGFARMGEKIASLIPNFGKSKDGQSAAGPETRTDQLILDSIKKIEAAIVSANKEVTEIKKGLARDANWSITA